MNNKYNKRKFILTLCLVFGNLIFLFSQETAGIEERLEQLSDQIPALEKEIDISVNFATLQEFLRGVAKLSDLNIEVDPRLDFPVVNNFSKVRVADIISFICKQYNLDITVIGNIITVYKPTTQPPADPEKLSIKYDRDADLFTIDYQDEMLGTVVKEITQLTGKNVILAPGIDKIQVNGYIQQMPFDNALDKFAFTNNLKLTVTDDQFYLLSRPELNSNNAPEIARNAGQADPRRASGKKDEYVLNTAKIAYDSISITAKDAPITEIIDEVSQQLGMNYFIVSELKGLATIHSKGIGFESFLDNMLRNSPYTFYKQRNVYIIGEKESSGLKDVQVIQLQNRTIDKILDFLPEDLLKDVQVVEFPELNSLLVSGPKNRIGEVEQFFSAIDKIVPVILIEVMILDVNKKFTVSTGIDAGLGQPPEKTGGSVFPKVDISMNSESINKMLNSFDGFGWLNLGNVSPDFYLNIRAMEDQGILDVKSTPRLSTLNGHEATLSIGNTEYYLEEQSNIFGTQNPQLTTSKTYKSVEATLSLTLRPVVSGDDQITIELDVQQSDFTERISQFAPPGTVSRNFKSIIRVKNQETILLGGLEEKRKSDSSSGTPFLSRIPIIKWIFSSRTREDSKSRLSVFIKPTIIN